jgi:hypothetical protein
MFEGLIIEDLTGRMNQKEIDIETDLVGKVKAVLERAWRIGDCIRATYRFNIIHYRKAVFNYFDQWYYPVNKDGYCELKPISYEQARQINFKAKT